MLLSDPEAKKLDEEQSIGRAFVVSFERVERLYTVPPSKGTTKNIEVRIINVLLGHPKVESGWLLFDLKFVQLAVGANLVGIRMKSREPNAERLSIEKLELSVRYRQ